MANNFYQTNNQILKLDPLKGLSDDMKKALFKNNDTLDIFFNHWITRKENLERTKGELDRGLFYLSYSIIETDFNISNKKARILVQRFIDKGIIEIISKGNSSNKKTLFAYTSIYHAGEEKGIVKGTVEGIVKRVNFNTSNTREGIVKGIVKGNSKKEKEKENIKSSTSTKKLSFTYTEMIEVIVRYRGIEVKAKRFNGEPKRFAGNKYIEHNGYIYEIYKDNVNEVDNHWKHNQCVAGIPFGGTEPVYQSKLPFIEIKKANT